MVGYSKKIITFPDWKCRWHRLTSLFVIVLVAHLGLGCVSPPSKQLYEYPEFGISLEKPKNWDLIFDERSGIIVLKTETAMGVKDSARVEIQGSACVPAPTWFMGPMEEIEANIDRIRILYDLDSVKRIQEPTKVEAGDIEVTTAIIAIPTMSLPENSVIIQVRDRGPNVFQSIEISAISSSSDHFTIVYVYDGNSEELNTEADEIVDGIQLTCSTGP